MTSQPAKKEMKFDQLMECNMINIFVEKSYRKCAGETSLRPFSKKPNCASLWMISLKFYTVSFCYMSKSRVIEYYWNYGGDHLLLPYINKKKDLKLVSLSCFLHDFWKKTFLI